MKKLFFILTATFLPFSSNAWEPCGTDYKGNTANCEYQIVNGTLTIRGTGDNGNIGWWQEARLYAPWYHKGVTNVVIEDSIKNLGYQGFSGITSRNSIVVPNSITSLHSDAFKGLYADEVIVPDSVTSIGSYAFCYATIKSINIPESVTSIGASAFMDAPSLKNVIIPDSVTSIGQGAFYGCKNLQSLTISDEVNLQAMFTYLGKVSYPSNLKIYCTGDTAKCDANLEAAGYPELKSIGATTKKINGVSYVYDKNGKLVTTSGHRTEKRIYTVEEANAVSGKINTVKLRYK